MDVVGRDQARRGQPADKPVTRSVRYQDREHDQHRDKLARGSELDGDNECRQDIDIGIESELFKLECDQEFNQQLKDYIDELQRVSRRVLRRESLRAWLRVRRWRQNSGKSAQSRQPRV